MENVFAKNFLKVLLYPGEFVSQTDVWIIPLEPLKVLPAFKI